jgi:hypothetical protein
MANNFPAFSAGTSSWICSDERPPAIGQLAYRCGSVWISRKRLTHASNTACTIVHYISRSTYFRNIKIFRYHLFPGGIRLSHHILCLKPLKPVFCLLSAGALSVLKNTYPVAKHYNRAVTIDWCFFWHTLKGQCHEIFHLWFFFFKQLLLVPVDMPSNDIDFFRIFAEIFDFSGALPVSTTPAKQTLLL